MAGDNYQSPPRRKIDILHLNASNYLGNLVYPYAFVQLNALCNNVGLTVARHDFVGSERSQWIKVLGRLIAKYDPECFCLYIRQVDTQNIEDYVETNTTETYNPLEDTKILINHCRLISSIPIIVGGFGFSVHPNEIFTYLNPDFGIQGEPDHFLANFRFIMDSTAKLSEIQNLVYYDKLQGQVRSTERVYFPPLNKAEYTEDIVNEMTYFYAKHGKSMSIDQIGEVDIPIEIMRGCPCSCYFCTEPHVKGKVVRYREIEAIMSDIEFLYDHGIRSVWLICSELNAGGIDFPLNLAKQIQLFRIQRNDMSFQWKAYFIPGRGINIDNLSKLLESGYCPGWNEYVSFSDKNLAACRMPYRARHAKEAVEAIASLTILNNEYRGTAISSFDLFLGNAFCDKETIVETLRYSSTLRCSSLFKRSDIITATRVYRTEGVLKYWDTGDIITFNRRDGVPDLMHPSFYISNFLLESLENHRNVRIFLRYLARTFFSSWNWDNFSYLGFLRDFARRFDLAHTLSECRIGLLYIYEQAIEQEHAHGLTTNPGDITKTAYHSLIDLWERRSDTDLIRLLRTPCDREEYRFLKLQGRLLVDAVVYSCPHALDSMPGREMMSSNARAGTKPGRPDPYMLAEQLNTEYNSYEDLLNKLEDSYLISQMRLPDIMTICYYIQRTGIQIRKDYNSLMY